MTEQQIQAEIHKIANESRDKIAKLQAALGAIDQAKAAAQAEAEAITGIALKRAKRQAAVAHFDQYMRPSHEAAMQQVGTRLEDWRKRFSESFNQFLAVAGEYSQIEAFFDQSMTELYEDAALCIEADAALGAGWDSAEFYRQIEAISQPAHFGKPLDGLNKKAIELASIKSSLNRHPSISHQWTIAANSAANQQRIQRIFDGLAIEFSQEANR